MLLLALFFLLAAGSEWLTLRWHKAREAGAIVTTVGLTLLLEALNWLPVWFAISQQDPWIAVVSIAGAGVGTTIGMVKVDRDLNCKG